MDTEKNSIDHWYLYSLAKYQEVHEEGARSRELFEFTNDVFKTVQTVSNAGSRCFHEKDLVNRIDENNNSNGPTRYRYSLNGEGIRVLRHLSIPRQLPHEKEELDEGTIEMMGMPEFVEEAKLNHPEPKPAEDKTKSTGVFSSERERRRYWARKREQEYLDWLTNEWAEENPVREEGEVTFEGLQEAAEDFLGRDDEDEKEVAGDPDVDGPFEKEYDLPPVEMTEFDPPTEKTPPKKEMKLPDSVSLEPNWEWYAAELLKRGLPGLAAKALNKEYTPIEMLHDIETILRKIDVVDGSGDVTEDNIYDFFEAKTKDKEAAEVDTE